MEQIVLLTPPPLDREAIWGDGSLAKKYGAKLAPGIDPDHNHLTGGGGFNEIDIIDSGEYAGKTLKWLYDNHKEYFGTPDEIRWQDMLPVSAGTLNAGENLSVQVHPREDWAQEHLGIHGKSECWYILDCPKDATIVRGHNAKTLEELDDYIARKDWMNLMRFDPIRPGDLLGIKAGTLHAIQKGTQCIEVCNPCPITYRFWDWDRVGLDGKPRELDIEKTRDNILVPYRPITFPPIVSHYGDVEEKWLANNEDYSVWTYTLNGKGTVPRKKPFIGGFVVEGEGTINGVAVRAGRPFLVSRGCDEFVLEGNMTVLGCHA